MFGLLTPLDTEIKVFVIRGTSNFITEKKVYVGSMSNVKSSSDVDVIEIKHWAAVGSLINSNKMSYIECLRTGEFIDLNMISDHIKENKHYMKVTFIQRGFNIQEIEAIEPYLIEYLLLKKAFNPSEQRIEFHFESEEVLNLNITRGNK